MHYIKISIANIIIEDKIDKEPLNYNNTIRINLMST